MTIDNDTALAVVRPLAVILESYRNNSRSDLHTLVDAAIAESKSLARAVRANKLDEAQGIANRLMKIARKANDVAEQITEGAR